MSRAGLHAVRVAVELGGPTSPTGRGEDGALVVDDTALGCFRDD